MLHSNATTTLALALVPALAAAALARAGDDEAEDRKVRVAGVLVDAQGAPVTGASVSTSWQLAPPSPHDPLVVGLGGRFAGELEVWREPFGLAAYTEDGALAGYALVTKAEAGDVRIEMKPAVRVTGEVTCSELGRRPDWANVMWTYGTYRIGHTPAGPDGRFEARLPQGEVSWLLYDRFFSSLEGELALDGSQAAVDLGTLDLPASFLQKNEGQPMPAWTVSEARGVALEQAQVASFRGKWLLVEFWGHW